MFVRDSYPPDEQPRITVKRPFSATFGDLSLEEEQEMTAADGDPCWSSSGGGSTLSPLWDTLPVTSGGGRQLSTHPLEPGDYHCQLRYEATLSERGGSGALYTAEVVVPLAIRVVPRGQEERVQPRFDPALQRRMLAAFISTPPPAQSGTTSINGQARRWQGAVQIVYASLPENAAFTFAFDNGQGHIVSLKQPTLVARAGDSGQLWPFSDVLAQTLPPGQYTGQIVLTPSPVLAQQNPALKTYYDGELRFPLQFTIR